MNATTEQPVNQTAAQYEAAAAACRHIFTAKAKDYGTSWRILRMPSITDQIFIKAQRIRTIDLKGTSMVNEGAEAEFIGVVNYAVIGLIQLQLQDDSGREISAEEAGRLFDQKIREARQLMERKNHDYGEAWRDMQVSSFTDLILMRILRIKQIEENQGQTLMSEGIDANLFDIINYAIFALIKISEA